jgi:MFS family permease
VAAIFFALGVLFASWVPHIPYVRDERALSEGALGLVLLALAGGAVVAMLAAGPVAARIGPHRVTRWMTLATAATLPLPVLAPNTALLLLALAIFGAAVGSTDVSMNAVAADVEARFRRPIMSSFHGMYSAGALVGSLLAAALIQLEVSPPLQTTVIAALVALAIFPSLRALAAPAAPVASARPRFVMPGRRVLVIGAMVLVFFLAEGAAADWSATLLRDDLGASGAQAALGFAAFSTAMALGRFAGDRINEAIGPVLLVGVGGVAAAIGLAAGLLSGNPIALIGGFALMGAGLANTIPVLFTAAARGAPTPSEGISSAATLGYLGLLAGPPLVGLVAELADLPIAMGVVAALIAVAALRASVAAPATEP